MASTMKKTAKAEAVKKGTFYECGWCGKEGTNAPYYSTSNTVVCGRLLEQGKKTCFCSAKCQDIYCAESNRKAIIADIDWANQSIDAIKQFVADMIKKGRKINPTILQVAKLVNVYKKVATLIVSGDKPSARKLYDEKKDLVTECEEDILADKTYEAGYMKFIDHFAELDAMMRDEYAI